MGFSFSPKQAVAILTLWAATVHSHIVVTSPPIEFPVSSTSQFPLEDDGSDYPCKFPPGYRPKQQTPTPLNVGGNTISLMGGATHGGGSCQISLTSDNPPTKESRWEVLLSIEGGCPSDAEGNLSDEASTPLPDIPFTIPDSVAPGTYWLAWTWFNRIGNREMYMNCGLVIIGGQAPAKRQMAKVTKKRQSALPDIFRANIGNGCSTVELTDVTFPDPGQNLRKGDKVIPGEAKGSCGAGGIRPSDGAVGNGTTAGGNGTTAGDSPSNDAPVNDAPVNDAPVNDAPVNDAPVNDAPANDAPANDAPANDAPANDAPVTEPGESPSAGQPCTPEQEGI